MIDITISLYFEIRDAEMYGGKGSVGYANVSTTCNIDAIRNMIQSDEKVKRYEEKKKCSMAESMGVEVENVRSISREEYEANTDEEE